jgi:exodeoxyribonuclease-3
VRIVSFNVNGIRARQHQLKAVTEQHSPDVLALQETKVVDDDFPLAALEDLGYPHIAYYGQKGHYGVALASRTALKAVQLGIPWRAEDQQRRFISAEVEFGDQTVHVINGYFPQGEKRDHPSKFPNKAEFYADVLRYCKERLSTEHPVIIAGDLNVAPADSDIGIGEDNKKRWLRTGKASFLPEEREWLDQLMGWGLTDTFQQAEEELRRRYSWFDYRSRGFEREPRRGLRIDLILASRRLVGALTGSGIDYEIRASEKPSDHCPIWAEFSL